MSYFYSTEEGVEMQITAALTAITGAADPEGKCTKLTPIKTGERR